MDQAENLLQNRINSVFVFFFLVISENEENTLYVVACNPVSLYFMNMTGKSGHFVDLFDIFPRTASGIWHPFVTVAPLGNPLKGQVVLHEQQVTTWPRYTKNDLREGQARMFSSLSLKVCAFIRTEERGCRKESGVVCYQYHKAG